MDFTLIINQFRRGKPSLHIAAQTFLYLKRELNQIEHFIVLFGRKIRKLLIGAQFSLATNKGLVTWCNFSCN